MRNSVNTPLMSGPSLAAGPMLVLGIVLSWVPATAEPFHGRESTASVLDYLDRLDRPERDQDQNRRRWWMHVDRRRGIS